MRGQILWAEQILHVAQFFLLAITQQIVRQTARLCALASIRAPSAERLAGQTLAAVRNAQRTMHEDFDWHRCQAADLTDLIDRQFTSQHDTLDPQFASLFDGNGIGHRHLSASMHN